MPHNRTPSPEQAAGDLLQIFLRLPVPGEVKTRLAKGVGPELASELYRAMAEWVFSHTAPPNPGQWRRWACFTPRKAQGAIQTWLKPHAIDHVIAQAPGDLGVRLSAATSAGFHARASRVLVIGTDCLAVDQGLVDEAFLALDETDLVVGPARDGGYYLLGLNQSAPKLFQRIPWGTDQVLAATLERAKELGMEVATLSEATDIDTVEDLSHLPAEFLAQHPELAATLEPHTT